MSGISICISISGAPGTGKRSLKRCLESYKKSSRGKLITFTARIGEESNSNDADFHLVVFDASQHMSTALEYWKHVTGLYDRSRCLMAGTKCDLIPKDHSTADLNARYHPAYAAGRLGATYFALDCLSGRGIDVMCKHFIRILFPGDASRFSTLLSSLPIYCDHFLVRTIDTFAGFFALPVPKDINRDSDDTEELTDEEVDALVVSPLAKEWDEDLKKRAKVDRNSVPTHRILPSLIAKRNSTYERTAVQYVRQHTRIPVPQLHCKNLERWMVSDFIDGEMLLECWTRQSLWMKFRIACTVRSYLAQLRQLSSDMPGRIDDHTAEGPMFDEEVYGPFQSLTHFQSWCEMVAMSGWRRDSAHRKNLGASDEISTQPIVGPKWKLVYAHGDLNMGNLLLSKQNVLWIIDWQESGFFPPWYDGVVLDYFSNTPRSWRFFIPFITGPIQSYINFRDNFFTDVHRFRF